MGGNLKHIAAVPSTRRHPRFRPIEERVEIREARETDAPAIQRLFGQAYGGRYTVDFAVDRSVLLKQIHGSRYLVLVAAEGEEIRGCVFFAIDRKQRLGKAAGAVVAPGYRGKGLGTALMRTGTRMLTASAVDVIYATTRTMSEAPSVMTRQVGFMNMGLFPNAVEVEQMEHLNLDVLLTGQAMRSRRPSPFIFSPYREVFEIARQRLGLEAASVPSCHRPLELKAGAFHWVVQQDGVWDRYCDLKNHGRLSNCFFPFHRPTILLKTSDGSTEVFACIVGNHRQSAILGYRTDRTELQNVLDSAARMLNRLGAAYVELLVDVYDYRLQQEAYSARFIPSAYFPAMHLAPDGLREDRFVVSRTFNLLDFSGTVLNPDNRPFLKAYLRRYYDLYLRPMLEDETNPDTALPPGGSTPSESPHILDLH